MSWTEAGGMQVLPGFPPGGYSYVASLSSNGAVAVGWVVADLDGQAGSESDGFVWNAASGPSFLGSFFEDQFGSNAVDVSSDGSVVVGYAPSPRAGPAGHEAFRWTAVGGLEPLGFLDESDQGTGRPSSWAEGVSGDGSIVVGNATVDAEDLFDGQQAFIWDAQHGMRNLREVLVQDYGLDLGGWGTLRAEAISADGRAIVGFGRNAAGNGEAWLALLPASGPAAVPLMGPVGLALMALLCCVGALAALGRPERIRRF
jgi:uncharacterized membrane protein